MNFKLITVFIALTMLNQSSALAVARLYNKHTFGDWKMYEGLEGNKKVCHAVIKPYRTRAFDGQRLTPWVAITFLGRNQLTVSGSSGFPIDKKKGWVVEINKGEAINLKVVDDSEVWTYSSAQDVQLINALFKGERYFTVRSWSKNKQVTLDYFALKGLSSVVKYMNKHCE
jgi:hypothetical protein